MAIVNKGSFLSLVKGSVGGMVIKQYKDKVVLSAKPDMSGVKASDAQLKGRKRFAAAVAYAKAVLKDPVRKEVFKRV